MVYPCKPQFFYIRKRFKWVYISQTSFPDAKTWSGLTNCFTQYSINIFDLPFHIIFFLSIFGCYGNTVEETEPHWFTTLGMVSRGSEMGLFTECKKHKDKQ